MNYYIADLHLGHANILHFDNRPFENLVEMHEAIIKNWNERVKNSDTVYILGDFAWNEHTGIEIIDRLKGKKRLIKGNHDKISPSLGFKFDGNPTDYEVVKDGDYKVVLCHFPIAHFINADRGFIHLYGHVHAGRDYTFFKEYVAKMQERDIPYHSYNVGCMMPYMNYTPRTLEEILKTAELS